MLRQVDVSTVLLWVVSTLRAVLAALSHHLGSTLNAAPDGITLSADINECVTDLHTCSRGEHCVNTVGSFRCYKALTCQPGYTLEEGECAGEDRFVGLTPDLSPDLLSPPSHPLQTHP